MNKSLFYLIATLFVSTSCTPSNSTKNSNSFFDVKSYFEKEAGRLSNRNPNIEKTVTDNVKSEKKTVNNIDWIKEFSVFINSSINKPAWNQSYTVTKTDSTEMYSALDKNLKTRLIKLTRDKKGTIREILIQNHTSNELYALDETLLYQPDKLYRIKRKQKAKLLEESKFEIEGKFL